MACAERRYRANRRTAGHSQTLIETGQETVIKALASAGQVYEEGDQALRAAYAEFKRTFEKRGDHWIPKQTPAPAR